MKSLQKCIIIAFVLCSSVSFAQDNNDPVLMKIADGEVTLSEFENIYKKNNTVQTIDQKSLDEYIELFINFKLKVKAAEVAGLDTTKKFIDELAGYRKQLAQPYLIDKKANEDLIQEAFQRFQEDVRASHILIRLFPNPSPQDTLAAYKKAMQLRRRLIKGGDDFGKIAGEVSEDPSAKENGGDLGWFTAFYMVYPFETAAYTTKIGDLSMPVRTKYGYHIIKVTGRRPAWGEMRCAHIMLKAPQDSTEEQLKQVEDKINEIYEKLEKGEEDFASLAKSYSDDKSSAKKGGQLPWFGVGRMLEEFEEAAHALKNDGDYSKPVKTKYGWHIIQRLETRQFDKLDEIMSQITNKVKRDSRASRSKSSLLARIKKELGYKPDLKSRNAFYKVVPLEYWAGQWDVDSTTRGMDKVMFTLEDKQHSQKKQSYSQQDFAKYLLKKMKKQDAIDMDDYVNLTFDKFVNESCLAFEESILEYKYPAFKSLMKEYRDGILLFELMDDKVWSKAVRDTSGLNDYYDKNKENFMWEERCHASIYTCANADIAKKVRKYAKKQVKKNWSDQYVMDKINTDSQLNLKIESGKFVKGDNEIIDKLVWAPGTTDNSDNNGKVVFTVIHAKLKPEPKTLRESKGLVTADYQTHLEKEWIEELRGMYPVEVNREVLNQVE